MQEASRRKLQLFWHSSYGLNPKLALNPYFLRSDLARVACSQPLQRCTSIAFQVCQSPSFMGKTLRHWKHLNCPLPILEGTGGDAELEEGDLVVIRCVSRRLRDQDAGPSGALR